VFGRDGAPISAPVDVGEGLATHVLTAGPGPSVFVIWRSASDFRTTLVRRFDADGAPLGDAFEPEIDEYAPCVSAGIVDDALVLVWAGMQRFRRTSVSLEGAALGELDNLGSSSIQATAQAWRGGEFGFTHDHPEITVTSPKFATTLEVTRQYSPLRAGDPGGWVVLWRDTRTDDSPACTLAEHCVGEVFGARLDARGRVEVGPRRLTTLAAQGDDFVPYQDQWRPICEHQLGVEASIEPPSPAP